MSLPTVTIKVNNVTVSDVQTYRVNKGRQRVSDPLSAGTCSVTGRRPDLLPTVNIGDVLSVDVRTFSGDLGSTYLFRVADLQIDYGPVSSMDEWTITAEDSFAVLGRATIDVSWAAGTSTYDAIEDVCTAAGVTTAAGTPTLSTVSAQTLTDVNALEIFSTIMATEQGRVITGYTSPTGSPRVLVYGRGWPQSATQYYASDDGTGTNPIKYTGLEFAGIADNYANKVVVEAEGLTTQTAGSGDFSYVTKSYSQTTIDAENLAQYLLGVFDIQNNQPFVMTTDVAAQTTNNARANAVHMCEGLSIVNIKFRSNTYRCMIEGFTLTGSPDNILVTTYLTSIDYYPIFILDDATNGILDTNRLSY